MPHTVLGHIRINSIKHNIKDTTQTTNTFERIKQRIIKTVTGAITTTNKQLVLQGVCIFDLAKRKCIKEYSFIIELLHRLHKFSAS